MTIGSIAIKVFQMRAFLLSILLFTTPTLSAELPSFEVSLGGGVQHDQAWWTIFHPATMTPMFSSKYTRLWIPYFRAEAGIGWKGLMAIYQADIGKGNWGKNDLSFFLSSTPSPFKTDLSDSRLWNQRATLNYDFSLFCFHFLPAIGWNRFESHWKVGPTTPSAVPAFLNQVGNVTLNLSNGGGDILEQFSGAFIGGDVAFAFGPLQVTAGYKYTFGSFSTRFDAFSYQIFNSSFQLTQTVHTSSFSATGEGQIGTATIEWWFIPCLSVYFQGEGRWIQKRKGPLKSTISQAITIAGESQSSLKTEFDPFQTRWDSYDLTIGARFSF